MTLTFRFKFPKQAKRHLLVDVELSDGVMIGIVSAGLDEIVLRWLSRLFGGFQEVVISDLSGLGGCQVVVSRLSVGSQEIVRRLSGGFQEVVRRLLYK